MPDDLFVGVDDPFDPTYKHKLMTNTHTANAGVAVAHYFKPMLKANALFGNCADCKLLIQHPVHHDEGIPFDVSSETLSQTIWIPRKLLYPPGVALMPDQRPLLSAARAQAVAKWVMKRYPQLMYTITQDPMAGPKYPKTVAINGTTIFYFGDDIDEVYPDSLDSSMTKLGHFPIMPKQAGKSTLMALMAEMEAENPISKEDAEKLFKLTPAQQKVVKSLKKTPVSINHKGEVTQAIKDVSQDGLTNPHQSDPAFQPPGPSSVEMRVMIWLKRMNAAFEFQKFHLENDPNSVLHRVVRVEKAKDGAGTPIKQAHAFVSLQNGHVFQALSWNAKGAQLYDISDPQSWKKLWTDCVIDGYIHTVSGYAKPPKSHSAGEYPGVMSSYAKADVEATAAMMASHTPIPGEGKWRAPHETHLMDPVGKVKADCPDCQLLLAMDDKQIGFTKVYRVKMPGKEFHSMFTDWKAAVEYLLKHPQGVIQVSWKSDWVIWEDK